MRNDRLTEKQVNDIISARTDVSPTIVKKVIKGMIQTIIGELQNNGYIYIQGLGAFKKVHHGGEVENISTIFGVPEQVKVKERELVEVIPAERFVNAVNNDYIGTLSEKELSKREYQKDDFDMDNKFYTYEDLLNDSRDNEDNETDKLIYKYGEQNRKMLEYQNDRRNHNKRTLQKYRNSTRIKCLTNGTIYDSIKEMADNLNLSYYRLRYAIKKGKNFIDGYRFQILNN